MDMLAKSVEKNGKDWDKHLPYVHTELTYNSQLGRALFVYYMDGTLVLTACLEWQAGSEAVSLTKLGRSLKF